MANLPRPEPQLDATKPCEARLYDYILGGTDNFEVDRREIERVLSVSPHLKRVAQDNRAFLIRCVEYLATEAGIRQFLDIGSGLPTRKNVHQIVQEAVPDGRVVYVDYDPMAVIHGTALLGPEDRVAYIQADLRKPADIVANEHVRRLIDFNKPMALLLVAILHDLGDDEKPEECVAYLRDQMAPGSYLALTHPAGREDSPDIQVSKHALREGLEDGGYWVPRDYERILGFFGDLDFVEPGLVRTYEWRTSRTPQPPGTAEADNRMEVYAGVGKVTQRSDL